VRILPGRLTDDRMIRSRRQLSRVMLESGLIVFSILLAFGVEEWRQGRRQAAEAVAARAAFAEEIRSNLALVLDQEHLPRRRRMRQRYQELELLPSPTGEDLTRIWTEFSGGIQPTPFRDVVWFSLAGADVMARLSYEERFLLADIYREQAKTDLWHERMFTAWSQPSADRQRPEYLRDNIQVTRAYLADVIAAEQRLVQKYEDALRRLGTAPVSR